MKKLSVLIGVVVGCVALLAWNAVSPLPAEASNGAVCCIVGVCCPPPGENSAGDAQTYELAKLVQEQLGSFSATGEPSERAIAVAQAILAEFDLVPNGVGDAIVKGYAESFSHKKK